MSTSENIQQLHQDLQNELTTANQLLRLISIEVNKIKKITVPEGILDTNIKQNAKLVKSIADMQQIDISNLPPVARTQLDMVNQSNQNLSYEQHDSFRNSMDDSQ
ncbi:unnamed protein product, partial [Brenthis ino]